MSKFGLVLKNDKYRRVRGGYSRLLGINCSKCGKHVCYYQKDGPGILKRMYLDRIFGLKIENKKKLTCDNCKSPLGNLTIYEKEHRLAFQLYLGAISKKIIKHKQIKL